VPSLVPSMSVPELVVEQCACACGVRGPFERPLDGAASDCILCAVDHAALHRFGAFTPLRRLSRRRQRQIAEAARWLLSLGAQSVVVLQPATATSSYLTGVLDFMQLEAPLTLHRLSQPASIRQCVAQSATLAAAARLQMQCGGASLARRLQRLNRLPSEPCSSDRCACMQTIPATVTMAVLRLALSARSTLVLGDWFELRALRLGLRAVLALPSVAPRSVGCMTLA